MCLRWRRVTHWPTWSRTAAISTRIGPHALTPSRLASTLKSLSSRNRSRVPRPHGLPSVRSATLASRLDIYRRPTTILLPFLPSPSSSQHPPCVSCPACLSSLVLSTSPHPPPTSLFAPSSSPSTPRPYVKARKENILQFFDSAARPWLY